MAGAQARMTKRLATSREVMGIAPNPYRLKRPRYKGYTIYIERGIRDLKCGGCRTAGIPPAPSPRAGRVRERGRLDTRCFAGQLHLARPLPLPACGERVGVRGRFH